MTAQACHGGSEPQWPQIHGLLERAIYGGRVDSAYDVVVLRTYLEQFFSNEMTGGGGIRQRCLPGTGITLPNSAHHGDYTAMLSELDEANSPSLFSLPVNVDRTVQVANSKHVITSLRTMAVAAGVASGFDRDAWLAQLQPLLRAWDRLAGASPHQRTSRASAGSLAPGMAGGAQVSTPVDAFVELEKTRGHAAVAAVERTLSTLGRVLRGTELLTPAVFAAGRVLMEGAVPAGWEKHWEGPEEPMAYCKAVVHRMSAVIAMAERAKGGEGVLLSKPVRLEDFFHPETFLNALRQQMAQQAGVAIDSLVLVTGWGAGAAVAGGAAVEGLRLQGAAFDGTRLADTASDAPPYTPLPLCTLAWVVPERPGAGGGAGGGCAPLHLPLYLTPERERAIADVQFPVFDAEECSKWVLAGAACFMGAQ
jgi:dynein heavy chain 2